MGSPASHGGSESVVSAPGRARLEGTAVAILALGLVYFVSLFFPWNALCLVRGQGTVCVSEFGTVSGWDGVGILAGLLVAILLVWEAAAMAGGLQLASQMTRPAIAAGLAAGVVLFTLLRVLTHLSGLTVFAWLGLALSVALAIVAVTRWLPLRGYARLGEPPATS